MNYVNYDNKKAAGLQKAYDEAVKNGKESFQFDGLEYVTGYAKYLLEYMKFKMPAARGRYSQKHPEDRYQQKFNPNRYSK